MIRRHILFTSEYTSCYKINFRQHTEYTYDKANGCFVLAGRPTGILGFALINDIPDGSDADIFWELMPLIFCCWSRVKCGDLFGSKSECAWKWPKLTANRSLAVLELLELSSTNSRYECFLFGLFLGGGGGCALFFIINCKCNRHHITSIFIVNIVWIKSYGSPNWKRFYNWSTVEAGVTAPSNIKNR